MVVDWVVVNCVVRLWRCGELPDSCLRCGSIEVDQKLIGLLGSGLGGIEFAMRWIGWLWILWQVVEASRQTLMVLNKIKLLFAMATPSFYKDQVLDTGMNQMQNNPSIDRSSSAYVVSALYICET